MSDQGPQRCRHCGAMNSVSATRCKRCQHRLAATGEALDDSPTGAENPTRGEAERTQAKKWYRWLWLSGFLTLPTLGAILAMEPGARLICGASGSWSCGAQRELAQTISLLLAVFGSALWHLILLFPATDKESSFVRWHGRQGLLLAAVRTVLAFVLGLALNATHASAGVLAALVLILVWLAGTIWGQGQAAHGDCSLMRWTGHEEELAELQAAEQEAEAEAQNLRINKLLAIIRQSRDLHERHMAVSELKKRGMVDPL